jgi:hypothetical protein
MVLAMTHDKRKLFSFINNTEGELTQMICDNSQFESYSPFKKATLFTPKFNDSYIKTNSLHLGLYREYHIRFR